MLKGDDDRLERGRIRCADSLSKITETYSLYNMEIIGDFYKSLLEMCLKENKQHLEIMRNS